jgi:hypothetical protein
MYWVLFLHNQQYFKYGDYINCKYLKINGVYFVIVVNKYVFLLLYLWLVV